MHRFYAPGFRNAEELALPEDESAHLARVLRLGVGDLVAIFDGEGHESEARVQSIRSKGVTVRVGAPRTPVREAAIHMTLVQALLKSDKMDRVIRDAVMLGVAGIQPVVSRRIAVPKSAVNAGVRHDRWTRTVISSVKQCGRAVVPPVHAAVDIGGFLKSAVNAVSIMFVEPGSTSGALELRDLENRAPERAAVLIGPEGGWDPEEIEQAAAVGVRLVTLRGSILRADAAGLVAVALLRYVWGDI